MITAVIFDLDGVIVSTDEFHYMGWKRLADEEGVFFDRTINERLRGVSRRESLEILLERATKKYTDTQIQEMMTRKNGYYGDLIKTLTSANILPGVNAVLAELRKTGVKMAVGSSSRNCRPILRYVGMADFFEVVVGGDDISNSKPHPEVFLLAAKRLGVEPAKCLVVEDAEAGVSAGLAAGMKVLAVGFAARDPRAHLRASGLHDAKVGAMLLG